MIEKLTDIVIVAGFAIFIYIVCAWIGPQGNTDMADFTFLMTGHH